MDAEAGTPERLPGTFQNRQRLEKVALVLTTLFFALSGRFKMHRRLARVTFPIWLYVSVTGVVVFVFLKAYAY